MVAKIKSKQIIEPNKTTAHRDYLKNKTFRPSKSNVLLQPFTYIQKKRVKS